MTAYIRFRAGKWEAVAQHQDSHAVIGRYTSRYAAIAAAASYSGEPEADIVERTS